MITMEKFAEREGVSTDTVRGWRQKEYIAVVRVGTRVLVDEELTDMRRREDAGVLAEYNRLKNLGLEGFDRG